MGGGGGGRDLIQKETFHRPCSVPVEGMRTHANAHTHTHTHTNTLVAPITYTHSMY